MRAATPDRDPRGFPVVEFPSHTTDEEIERFKQAWCGGPVAYRRKGDPEPVRVTAKWFTTDGNLIECQTRETVRGPGLHTLLAAWSDRPFAAQISIEPIGDDDA